MCRGSLRNINRYSRNVRQGFIEQATQKFILWANGQYVPLEQQLYNKEKEPQGNLAVEVMKLHPSAEESVDRFSAVRLGDSPANQTDALCKLTGLQDRYKSIVAVRKEISRLLKQVSEQEQPICRVSDMVQDVQ